MSINIVKQAELCILGALQNCKDGTQYDVLQGIIGQMNSAIQIAYISGKQNDFQKAMENLKETKLIEVFFDQESRFYIFIFKALIHIICM